jgi:hypothetical protein
MIRSASLRRSEDRSGERFLTYDPSDKYSGSAIAGCTCGFFLNIVRSMGRLLVDDVLPLSALHKKLAAEQRTQENGDPGCCPADGRNRLEA